LEYRKEIDGLRAIAVLPVIFYHAGFNLFKGGFVGVDVFFVISGYLITTIILSDMEKNKFSIVKFYERRARRILPALFFVMLCCIPFAWLWLIPEHMRDFSESLSAISLFSSNFLFWEESGYFETAAELKPLLHTWSLAVEEQYYLIFPLFLMLLWKSPKRKIFSTLFFIAVISLIISHFGAFTHPSSTFFLLHTRAWELAIGALIAFYFLYKKSRIKFVNSHKLISEISGLTGLVLIWIAVFCFNEATPFPSFYALIPTVGAGLIIIFSTHDTFAGKILSIKPLVGLGLISYSAYLWHQPLFVFARHRNLSTPDTNLLVFLSFCSILMAFFSWRFVEKPFRKQTLISQKKIFIFALSGSIFFISFGSYGHLTNGIPNRLDKKTLKLITFSDGRAKGCDETKTNSNGFTCIIGSKKNEPTAALIGDSHSTRLTLALSNRLKEKNRTIIVYSRSWGVPLLDVGASNSTKGEKNREFMTNAFEEVVKNKKIKDVFLFAEWANYTTGGRWKNKTTSFYTDKYSKEKSLDENQKVFERGLERTLNLLKNADKNVFIIGSVPEYEVYIVDYLAKSSHLTKKILLPEELSINKKKYIKRNLEVIKAFEILNKYKNVTYIDAFNIFCKNDSCRYIDENSNIFYQNDGNHLTYYGSIPIVEKIETFLY